MENGKNTVTIEDVKENMKNVIVRTENDFGKPCTYVTVRMENGFTLRESTTCVDPANYDEDTGKAICLKRLEEKVWSLLGYQLQEELYRQQLKNGIYLDRMKVELQELQQLIGRLENVLDKDVQEAEESYGKRHYEYMLAQLLYMKRYASVLKARLELTPGE
jgi:hypothetical protein